MSCHVSDDLALQFGSESLSDATWKTKVPSNDVPKFQGLGRLQGKTLFTTVEIDLFRLLDSHFPSNYYFHAIVR